MILMADKVMVVPVAAAMIVGDSFEDAGGDGISCGGGCGDSIEGGVVIVG